MGNPLASLLANLYMEFYERDILPTIDLPFPLKWDRYVDDIIVLFKNDTDVELVLNKLNNLVPSIQFTLESENNCKLPFLDVLIHRNDRQFKFKIYRKPTNINSFIHNFSEHEEIIKQSSFRYMFLRALRIVSPEYLNEEISLIYSIGYKHSYSKIFLDRCYYLARKSYYNIEINDRNLTQNILCLPFHSIFKSLPNLLKHLNIKVVFKYTNNVQDLLIKNGPINKQGVIYKIDCNNCEKQYIGQTGRHLNIRLKEHKYAIDCKNSNNSLFNHYLNTGHSINLENANIILYCNSYHERILLESYFIKTTNNFNSHPGMFCIDNIGEYYIKKSINGL